jgi:enoyl-CoA hydratase
MPLILTQRSGAHTIVTLNRPDKLNALSYELIDELMACLDDIEADDALRTVILTGAGPRAFSAGADIAQFAADIEAGPEPAQRRFVARGQAFTRRVEAFAKPIIAAVNGLALGGGCETVEACALAVGAEHAIFGKPEITLGFAPPFGGTQRLPRHIGRKRGIELILTGDPISAARAETLGLINHVVAAGKLIDECLSLADRIARHSSVAVTAALRAINRGINLPIDEALQVEAAQFMIAAATPSAREATGAFVRRRAT